MNATERQGGTCSTFLCRLGRGLDIFRRVILNVVFFVIFIYVLSFLLRYTRPAVPDSTVLVLSPSGAIGEQLGPVSPMEKILGLTGPETLLKDLLDAVDAGKDDPRVKVLLLSLGSIGPAELPKLQELAAAIKRFKESGKKVIASADDYDRNSYYLAAHADEIYIHRGGMLTMEGYSRYRRFYKEALDKLKVDLNIFRIGKYKSALEPYFRGDMSEEDKESASRWLGALWDYYLSDVAAARGKSVEELEDYVERFSERLEQVDGRAALMAKNAGLVDHVVDRDVVQTRLIELVGEDKDTHSYYRIGYKDYLEALENDRYGDRETGDVVAVIEAIGDIRGGHQPPGSIGGESTGALIRKARLDKHVKAVLLRVDSGGGSSFASELIHRELELVRKEGKPVVVSMGSVAASGGYWISMASDEVWAYPATITGSIGIYFMFPTLQDTLETYLGIHVDGIGTNKQAGALRVDRKLSPEVKNIIRLSINRGYNDFINLVARARNKTPEEVDEIARGRVWIGSDAHKHGLVDHLGGFSQALDSAAKLAKLGKDYKVKYFRHKLGFEEALMQRLLSDSGAGMNRSFNPFAGISRQLLGQMARLARLDDPHGLYAYWLDDVGF
jgi:protease-4